MINQFRGKYYFLSNMSECTINFKGFTFKSVESAFQAFKNPTKTKEFESLDPVSAKKLGRKVPLRFDWQEIKLNLMYELLQEKFKDPILKQKLLSTGNEELIEGNYWKDLYWGVDLQTNKGENHLGKLLMKVREKMTTKLKYAGIGSRQTPINILQQMKNYAKRLAPIAILQTGGALGADSAFEEGAKEVNGEVILYLPWRGYNNKEGLVIKASKQKAIEDFASKYHPAWDKCSPATRKMHARNMLIINETDFVICWTSDGKDTGGTGQGIRFARDEGIPVYNLFNKEDRDKLEDYLQSLGV